MGRRYATMGTQTTGSSAKTLIGLTSVATTRPRIYDFVLGSDATPADQALRFFVQRYSATTDGVGTSYTPTALDPGDPASLLTAVLVLLTTEYTPYTSGAILFDVAMNQRSTQRWVAAPGGELVLPATAGAGAGVRVIHASATPTVRSILHHEE